MSLHWFEHKGFKILYIDYRGLASADAMNALVYASLEKEIANPGLLELVDFRGVKVPLEYVDLMTDVGQKHRNLYVRRCAILGLNGVKRYMYKTYCKLSGDKTTAPFKGKDDALEWLISTAPDAGGNPRFCSLEESIPS